MPELMGKLDTSVNGPDGLPRFDGDAWDCVDWRRHEEQVRRLRGRIFKAVQEGDWPLWLCQPELAPLFSFDLAPPRGSAEREFSFDLAPLPAGPVRLALICWRLVRCRPGAG